MISEDENKLGYEKLIIGIILAICFSFIILSQIVVLF